MPSFASAGAAGSGSDKQLVTGPTISMKPVPPQKRMLELDAAQNLVRNVSAVSLVVNVAKSLLSTSTDFTCSLFYHQAFLRQGASIAGKAAPPPFNKLRPPPPQPYYTSYRRGGAYSQLVHSRSPARAAVPTPPSRKAPESSFNENSPAGIAVNALLMAANAMDFGSKPKDEGDGPSVEPKPNDSASARSEEEMQANDIESIPKSPGSRRSLDLETVTKDTTTEPQKTVEVSPDERKSRKRSLGPVSSESPLKSAPNLEFIKKKARPLPTSSSKKIERNVSADDAEDEAEPLGKAPLHSVKAPSIQELL